MSSLKTLHVYTYPAEIYALKARLSAEDIPFFTNDELTISINPLLSNAIGGLKLKVMEHDYERAKRVLDDFYRTLDTDRSKNDPNWDKNYERVETWCPVCESSNVYKEKTETGAGLLNFFLALILRIPWAFSKQKHFCADCGHTWER
jgi:hypothetical protein